MAESSELHSSKSEINPPDFLNEEFFNNVLKRTDNDENLTITNLKFVLGTKPGDNYASIMFKAIVSYFSKGKSVNSRSLVIKTFPVENVVNEDMTSEMLMFEREIDMYTKVLPEMKRIMESIGEEEELSPNLVYHIMEPPTLIFDDIASLGYEMHYKLFEFENTVKIIKKLAKFHALSYYINDNKYNHPYDLAKYTTTMTDAQMDKFKVFFCGFDYLQEEVEKWPGYERIAEVLATQSKTFREKLLVAYQPNPNSGFNVLCHGDFHIKNMMFLMNGEDVNKTMFLDFQLSYWGSPATDLLCVFHAIGGAECRKRRGEILSIYHESLIEYLNCLGCLRKPPTLLDLNIEMLKKGPIEILWAVCFLPFFHLDFTKIYPEDVADTSPEVMSKVRKLMYTNEEVVKTLKETLPELLYKGILA